MYEAANFRRFLTIYEGEQGTGKTWRARKTAAELIMEKNNHVTIFDTFGEYGELLNLHRPVNIQTQITTFGEDYPLKMLELIEKSFYDLDSRKNFYLIIDGFTYLYKTKEMQQQFLTVAELLAKHGVKILLIISDRKKIDETLYCKYLSVTEEIWRFSKQEQC